MITVRPWPDLWTFETRKLNDDGDAIACMVPHANGRWVRLEDFETIKRAMEAKDAALMDAAREREQAWLVALIDRFPSLDISWDRGTQDLWWASFKMLRDKVDGLRPTAQEQTLTGPE